MADRVQVLCAHGYVLMQDGCPGCDSEAETAHQVDPVRVVPSWTSTPHTRCRRCTLRPSDRIHTKGGTR